jgi:hypothetical protein
MLPGRLQQVISAQSIHQCLGNLSPAVQETEQPINSFWKLVDRDMLENVKSQSNIFSVQCDPSKSLNVSMKEIEHDVMSCNGWE